MSVLRTAQAAILNYKDDQCLSLSCWQGTYQHMSAAATGVLTQALMDRLAGMAMGCLSAGIALCFMKMHFLLKRIWLRLGLHVRPHLP